MFNQTIVENELTDRSGHRVKFSYETFYSPDDFVVFRKVFIDGKETAFKINMESLQEAASHGTVDEKYNEIATEINSYLLTERQ